MKKWHRQFEWMGYAGCLEDVRFISDEDSQDEDLESICHRCPVRPECIEFHCNSKASSVFVAGVRLPDPEEKKELKRLLKALEASLPMERERRGDDV